jgi:EAL domain-containing protein (putative c-di-GMP-specific phosphodiesterase class I)
VRTVLTLAADLGLSVVAEGVETPAQARALAELGCGMAQGLLYGPAVPVERLAPVLDERVPPVVDARDAREAAIAPVVTGGD